MRPRPPLPACPRSPLSACPSSALPPCPTGAARAPSDVRMRPGPRAGGAGARSARAGPCAGAEPVGRDSGDSAPAAGSCAADRVDLRAVRRRPAAAGGGAVRLRPRPAAADGGAVRLRFPPAPVPLRSALRPAPGAADVRRAVLVCADLLLPISLSETFLFTNTK